MASGPFVEPTWKEITFEKEKLDARSLITRTDLRGIITFASLPYRQMTKFRKTDLLGNPHSIVRHPFMPEAVFKEMWKFILEGKCYRGIIMNLRRDGHHYWVEVTISPINEQGNIVKYEPEKIKGFIAIRREPTREEIQNAYLKYKMIRYAELIQKTNLKEWERELLKRLNELPYKSSDLILL